MKDLGLLHSGGWRILAQQGWGFSSADQATNAHLRRLPAERKLIELKVFAKLASAFLLVWLFASPAMACLLPAARLSPEEMACCRDMGGMCDDMAKNTSHACCVKDQPHNQSYVVVKTVSVSAHQLSATPLNFALVIRTIPVAAPSASMPAKYGYPPGHSPPTLPELVAFRI
jgi:hypothetical protein